MWIKLNDLRSSFVNFSKVYEIQHNNAFSKIDLLVIGSGINSYHYNDPASAEMDYGLIIKMLEGR